MRVSVLLILILLTSCSTFAQAKRDFSNFKKTIIFNSKQKAVYSINKF